MGGLRRRRPPREPLMAEHPVPWAVLIAVVCGLVALVVVAVYDRLRK